MDVVFSNGKVAIKGNQDPAKCCANGNVDVVGASDRHVGTTNPHVWPEHGDTCLSSLYKKIGVSRDGLDK